MTLHVPLTQPNNYQHVASHISSVLSLAPPFYYFEVNS